MSRIFILVLFAVILLKSITWLITIPIWQTPDEQAHFAQLQWLAEKKSLTIDPDLNLSAEVATSEAILGTYRDPFGNNKFTYHPEYKNPIVGGFQDRGLKAFNLPQSYRTIYVGREAAMYPWLYYQLDMPLYNLFYQNSIIDRVYASRFLSLICLIALVFVAYKIGQEIWGKDYKAVVLAILVGFHPMISFVAAGIHPDNLLNLLYSLVLLLCLLILKSGIKTKYLIACGVCIFAGYETKTLMILIIPLVGAVICYKSVTSKLLSLLGATVILALPVLIFITEPRIPFVPVVTVSSPLYKMNFLGYLHFRLPKMFFEVWPWYWGVFKWLSLTLPPIVLKVITRVAILAVVGVVMKLFLAVKRNKYNFELLAMVLFTASTVSYIVYLLLWDWRLMQSLGFSQGLQGRYFFPNIVGQMAILIFGLSWGSFSKPILVVLALGMIVLNFFALHLIFVSY